MSERIGLLVGWEESFPAAFIERANRVPGITADLLRIGYTTERHASPYRVLVDRISHEVKHYRFHLKAAALSGTYVINDPFWWSADDKFFGYSVAARLGVAVPRTAMLPQKDYPPSIVRERSLRNLVFPLPWEEVARYVGFPAILKPADGGGWKDVTRVDSVEELLAAYDRSGLNVMTLQEFIDFDEYVRCICIGKDFTLPIQYDPRRRCYIVNDGPFLPPALHARIVDDAAKLNHALGYDMNSVEFAIRDGVPYAIDFTNPAPDFHVENITSKYFEVVVEKMVELTVRLAREGRRPDLGYPFARYLARGADGERGAAPLAAAAFAAPGEGRGP